MTRPWKYVLWPCAVAAGFGLLVTRQSLRAAPATPVVASPSSSFVNYVSGAARWLNVLHVLELSQGVTLTQDDATLKTDAAVVNLNGRNQILTARSQAPVHLYDPQNDLTGRQGFVDFQRHIATLTGGTTLVVKPGPCEAGASPDSLRSQFKDAATLTCDALTYDYRRKVGLVPGPLTVRQVIRQTKTERVLSADSGKYDTRAQVITLTGNVHGHNGRDQISTSTVTIGTKEGAEFISIPVKLQGVFGVPPEDQTPEQKADDAAPAPQGTLSAAPRSNP